MVYILYSKKRSRYYVGHTADIVDRLKRHNQGSATSTKVGIPWNLVLKMELKTRSEAMILERKIKKRGAERFIEEYLGV